MYSICMKGNIYTSQKCPSCGGKMLHNDRKSNCFCVVCGIPASKGYMVRFGREICKRFSSYAEASQFLSGLRFKTAEGSYDRRDYMKENPLSFKVQAQRWLALKESAVSRSHYLSLTRYITKAIDIIGNKNVKTISYGDLEDFFLSCRTYWSDKTRANARSVLHDFFQWLKKREGLTPPELPEIDYELGYRRITTLETQRTILEEINRIAPSKVAFGVELLATYPSLRPDDLLRLTEGNIRGDILTIRNPTKLKNKVKVIRLLEEHADQFATFSRMQRTLPNVLFFRHEKTISGCRKDEPYGKRYFYKWWIKACANLGIEGLDLYGGTRHTTTTAIADMADSTSAKKASGHLTNKAFDRYCQSADTTAFKMARLIKPRATDQQVINIKNNKETS